MESARKIRIAISGGGLAGAAVARALLQHDHLEINIYESASAFSEKGMAVGMAINAQRALKHLVGDTEGFFSRARAVSMNSTRIMMSAKNHNLTLHKGTGPQAGTKILDVSEEHPGKSVHRAALLHELLEPIPSEYMHTNKRLVEIDDGAEGKGLTLKFEDGTTTTVDALIGADGIFGFVRSHVLGADHPAVEPVAAGWAGSANLVPFEKAMAEIGAQWYKENRQYGWVGPNGIMIHDLNDDGKMVQCIATSVDDNPSGGRLRPIDRGYLERKFSDWLDGPVGSGMVNLLLDQEHPAAFAQREYIDAPTYVNGRVCIMGDAAHAMTPWQGSSAAMALEDAVILGCLFARIDSLDQVNHLMSVYDKVRRPRTQRVALSSRLTGRILSGIDEDVGLDPVKMRHALRDRWSYIHGFDLEEHISTAISELGVEA